MKGRGRATDSRAIVEEPDRRAIELYPRVGDDRWSDASVTRLTWAFVTLGVTIRLTRFLLVHPLWGDECFVAANLIDRGYLGLTRPLDYQQVAPVLFLWGQLAITRLLGLSEGTLRVLPTACSIAGLFVFRHLASRLLKGMPLLLAVAIVAVALNPVRHGGESKPYACDFLASTILLALLIEWWREPDRARAVWWLAGLTPIVMGFSLPSVFVLGGISLAMLGRIFRGRRPRVIAAYVTFNKMILVSAVATLLLQGQADSSDLKAYMDHYWSGMFPPFDDPLRLIPWLIKAHTGQLFAYPVGGANGASLGTFALAICGIVDLTRRGRGTIVLACVAPLGLALIASSARIYPYGESERLMQFAGPMVCLLTGYGLAWGIGRFRRPGSYRRGAVVALIGLGLIGVGGIVADIASPTKTPSDLRTREFARWFWAEQGRDAELICARVDLGLDFEGGYPHDGRSADYLTYQRIYRNRRRSESRVEFTRLSPGHPLRCVIYDGVPVDSLLFEKWMARMARHYRLSRVETFRVNSGDAPRSVSAEDHLAVLEFAPIGEPVDPARLAREAVAEVTRASRGSLTLPGR